MIIDARTLPGQTVIDVDLCIIGAGPAGITLAREFAGCSVRVALLEAGGFQYEPKDQDLYAGETTGLPYERLDRMRSRFFGGSSNCWGGFCRPFDEHDLEARDWVPNSGWPFGREELTPWYQHAHALLEFRQADYDPSSWERKLHRRDARCIPFDRDRARNVITQISPPTRFGELYRDDIVRSDNVTAYLNASVTEIDAPGDGSHVAGVEVRTRAGTTLSVTAQRYVLATGGIETARLLLCSDRHQPAGLGNGHDVVGRYFMDHPRLRAGRITFRDPQAHSSIYDMHVVFPGGMMTEGTKVGAFFGLSPEVQRAERIGNTRSYVVSRFVGDDPQSYDALVSLYEAIHNGRTVRGRRAEVAAQILRRAPQVAVLGLGLKFRPSLLRRGYTLETVVEPTPLPESRVTLIAERDAMGMRRVKVDWRVGELEKRTIRRTQEILNEELQRIQAGAVEVEAPHEGKPWPQPPKWCWHHMGTARMHTNPRRGVVDANSRVHGTQNLFVAGSSIFPTCGSDMPTINIVALALRLAAHLKAQFRLPTHAAMQTAQPS